MEAVKRTFKIKFPRMRFFPALAVCLSLVVLLGWIDYSLGWELSFSIFYLVPISLAVLMNGRTAGFVVSVISAVVWMLADIGAGLDYTSLFYPVWSAAVRLGYFILHCWLIGKLLDTVSEVRKLSFHDPLTMAANWRFFEEYASTAMKSAIRKGRPVTLAFLDLDNFKELNDRLGHAAGDEALALLARTVRARIRPEDMLARLGGDEFAVILPGAGYEAADLVLRRLHEAVTGEMSARGWGVTVSMGAVTSAKPPPTVGELLARADSLMYAVKKNGKNAMEHAALD